MPETTDIVLVLVCFVVSLFSPAVGTSGGVTFAAMATVMPPATVVPIHALIEGLSSAIRWRLLREFVDYRFLATFTLGGVIGFLAGWPLIGSFSDDGLRILLGAFFLFSSWAPLGWMHLPPVLAGASTSCLSVLVGATGPLVAALIARDKNDHRAVIGNQGACTTFQHWGKTLLFTAWGFSFASYAGLIVALILATIIGTWLGKRILLKTPQSMLRLALKMIVTILGLQLLIDGLGIRPGELAIGSWTGTVVFLLAVITSTIFGYRLGASDTGKTIIRAMCHRARDLAARARRPGYALVAAVILLAGAAVTLPHRTELAGARSTLDTGINATPATATSPQLQGVVATGSGENTGTGNLFSTAATSEAVPVVRNVADSPRTALRSNAAQPPADHTHSSDSKDVTSNEGRLPDAESRALSLQTSRALSGALTRYWTGDALGAVAQLAGDAWSDNFHLSDRAALGTLREQLQQLSQRYADGQSAFLRGDKERAYEQWHAFMLDEKDLRLPTWSRFALEVKARVVDDYTMRGDEADARGRAQAARQLWARATSIDPRCRAAGSLNRSGKRITGSVAAARTDNTTLDKLADLLAEDVDPQS